MTTFAQRLLQGVIIAGCGAAFVRPAAAESAVIATRPALDAETGDLVFFVGAINEAGRSLKASSLEIVVDGQPAGAPVATQSLSDWATAASEASQAWRPPLAVGLVYLWVEGVPASVLDGIQGFFQRVPSRTPVYPTLYGRMRQGRARLTAADVGRLGDVSHIEGYRPNLLDALRLDLPDLAADGAALKLILLVTDGRDFADPKGDGPGDFAALGRDIRKTGVVPIVVAFPPPEADAAQAAANLRDLHEAAGGFLRTVDNVQDIENALESLGQAVADLQRVRFATPTGWRMFGGAHRLSVRLTGSDGQRLTYDMGSVTLGSSRSVLFIGLGAIGLLLVAVAAFVALRSRGGGRSGAATSHHGDDDEDQDDDGLLLSAHDLIKRGASPKRAVDELTRTFPDTVARLAEVAPETFTDPRFPYFRTRPGRLRLQEMQNILAKRSQDRPGFGSGVAGVLAEAVDKRIPPDKAAETLAGRVAGEELTAFAGLDLEQLAEALRAAAGKHGSLATPRARGLAVAIQDALRAGGGARGVQVGWLVRSGGPGRRGETLRLGEGRTLLGQGPSCTLRISGDAAIAAEHAEFSIENGEFVIVPREGGVSVEGQNVERRHNLSDGETIAIGNSLFVFKSASSGNLSTVAPPSRGDARRSG